MQQYNQKGSSNIVPLTIGWVISVFLLLAHYQQSSQTFSGVNMIYLIFPIVALLTVKLVRSLIKIYCTGLLPYIFQRILSKMEWGTAIFLFMLLMPDSPEMNLASYGVLFLTLLNMAASLLFLIEKYIVPTIVVKAFIHLLRGVIIFCMTRAVWGSGVRELNYQFSLSNIIGFGYAVLFLCTLLSLLVLSNNQYLKTAGRWFGASPYSKLIGSFVIAFVFGDLRISVMKSFPEKYELIEWIVFGVLLLISAFIIFIKVQDFTRAEVDGNLKRHIQEITYNKGNKLNHASACIEQFINTGEKSSLITFIIVTAMELGISQGTASNLIKPLMYYEDKFMPLFQFSSEINEVHERNKKDRKVIVERVIVDLKGFTV